MTHWYFIAGAYAVTLVVILVEILAVRARHRAARGAASSRDSQ